MALGAVLAAAGLFWLFVALRVTGPLVLIDEYVYVVRGMSLDGLTRLQEIAPSVPTVGNYLFLRVINLAARAQLPLDTTMKAFNVACLLVATWLLGRRILAVGDPRRAVVLAALVALLPAGSYVAYVMPESAYLLAFVTLFAVLLDASEARAERLWGIAGALCAVMTLIKAHGVFVLAAFLAATLVWSLVARRVSGRKALGLCLLAILGFAIALSAGVALIGPRGAAPESVVGEYYWGVVQRSPLSWGRIGAAARFCAVQLSAVLVLLAPSLGFLAASVLSDRGRQGTADAKPGLRALQALFLLAVICGVIALVSYLLTAEPDRLQFRYISFAFPCVLTLCWIWQTERPTLDTRAFRIGAAALWLAGTAIFVLLLPTLRPLPADAPELFFSYNGGEFGALGVGPAVRWGAGGLVAAGALALLHPRIRWFDVQLAALAILVPVADLNTVMWQGRWSAEQAPYRAIGETARRACGPGENDIVSWEGEGDPSRFFTVLEAIGRAVPIETGMSARVETLAPPPRGCVIAPEVPADIWGAPLARAPGLALYRPVAAWRPHLKVPFTGGIRPPVLGQGWSQPEAGGVWTAARQASLEIPLPDLSDQPSVLIEIDAFAYRPPGPSPTGSIW
jgi:hypothetical protein